MIIILEYWKNEIDKWNAYLDALIVFVLHSITYFQLNYLIRTCIKKN